MGQQTSSESCDNSVPVARKSYYELLGVEKSASEDDIKRAYHKKALELHPDRNYSNVTEATKLFADVQSAYEVLSDPQEREWYDSHEYILLSNPRTCDGSTQIDSTFTSSDDVAKLYANFSGQTDFSDSSNGFFSSLREVFEKIAYEESVASNSADIELTRYPTFGSSKDDYTDVVRPFYEAWLDFSTRKTFAWKDVYRLTEASNRNMKRAMEKENRRLREEAVREYNDTVRTFVNFVKKRDPRQRANVPSYPEQQQALRDLATRQAARARAANQARLSEQTVSNWTTAAMDQNDQLDEWVQEDDGFEEHFECVVCNKTFKTEKQYDAHARSKKHLQAVKKIRKQMQKDDLDLDLRAHQQPSTDLLNDIVLTDYESLVLHNDLEDCVDVEPKGADVQTDARGKCFLQDKVPVPKAHEQSRDTSPSSSVSHVSQSETSRSLADPRSSEAARNEFSDTFVKSQGRKASEKRARKAARATLKLNQWHCTQCLTEFASKSQLFNHLRREPSHAQPQSDSGQHAARKKNLK